MKCIDCTYCISDTLYQRDKDGVSINPVGKVEVCVLNGSSQCSVINKMNNCASWREKTILQEVGLFNIIILLLTMVFIQVMPLLFEV